MIVSFSIENFRSFASEETLNLAASNRVTGQHDNHAISIPGNEEKVLRTAVIYGANGAGKSNIFKALHFLRSAALQPKKKGAGTNRDPFRFTEGPDKPTSLDLQFIAGEKLYRYGVKIDDHHINEEWLVLIDKGREKELYERVTTPEGQVKINAKGLKLSGDKVKALATIGGPHNQTFLATVYATLEESDYGPDLTPVIDWFEDKLTLIRPNAAYGSLGSLLVEDPSFLEFASDFLRSSATGVNHLKPNKTEISEEQLQNLLPKEVLSEVISDLEDEGETIVKIGDGKEIIIEKSDENHYFLLTIQAVHETKAGKTINLDIKEESDGTLRLLNLIPALHYLRTNGGVFVIDEIDRSMHPLLTWKFLDFFLKCCSGEQKQIIVTTHESNLLDLELLRRDEIWFTEKGEDNATKLYSLSDFKIRTDLAVRKHYLQGRFGAVPFLGSLDRLLVADEVTK